jgi:HlyD family secretion protein
MSSLLTQLVEIPAAAAAESSADASNAPVVQRAAEPARQRRFTRRQYTIAALFLAALGLAGYGATQKLLGPKVPAFVVTHEDVLQTIVASGRVETPLRVAIGSQITGTVAAIPVAEGQTIKARQLLIALEDGEARAAAVAARAGIVQAQAKIRQIHDLTLPSAAETLRRANANLQNARLNYERSIDLQARGFIGQSQLDEVKMNLDVAESQVRSAALDVEANGPQGSAYQMAQTELAQARAGLATALARLDYTTIEAPVDGTLIARDVERGDVVQPGKTLMVLSPAGSTQLVVQIDEKNLSALRLGQPALGSADAYPNERFAAQVAYINPAVDPQRGSVEVKLNVSAPPAYLRQDMTVSVDIEVARRPHALVVASSAVHDGAGTAPWVLKVEADRARHRPVRIGARGAGKVEVLEGLQGGDVVLGATGSSVADGQRVRATPANGKAKI